MFIIEHIKTYEENGIDNVHVSFFKGMSKVIPCLEFSSRMIDAKKYKTKKDARNEIEDFNLENKKSRCVVLKI